MINDDISVNSTPPPFGYPHPQDQKRASDDQKNEILSSKLAKTLDKMDQRLAKIEDQKELPVEARLTKIEGRLMILEGLLTEETPTGKTRVSPLGKRIKIQRRY